MSYPQSGADGRYKNKKDLAKSFEYSSENLRVALSSPTGHSCPMPEVAPSQKPLGGCRGFKGPFPPPLWIRVIQSIELLIRCLIALHYNIGFGVWQQLFHPYDGLACILVCGA